MNPNSYERDYFETIHRVDEREKRLISVANLRFLQSKKKNIQRILDIGCGLGEFLEVCAGQGMETFGLDISKFAIDKATSSTESTLQVLDVATQKWPFKNNFFDAVCAFDILEHMKTPNLAISEAYRVLKKGGIFLATTPNGDLEKSRIRKKLLPSDPSHINIHDEQYWMQFFRRAGFAKFNCIGCLFFCFPPIPRFRQYLRIFRIKSLVNPVFFPIKAICATLYLYAAK